GNWEWTGIVTARSGGPFTITAGQDQSKTGLNQDRGVQVAGLNPFASGPCSTSAYCVSYLNKAAFTGPPVGTFGMFGKNSFRGPRFFNWDMGLFKNMPISEHFRLEFRAEFFNIFNRANFHNPNSNVSANGFGTITEADSPRIGQLALKLIF